MRRWGWLVSLLVLSTPVAADEWETYPQQGVMPYLGLDDTSAPTQVQDGRAVDLQNVRLDISKGLRQRYGISLVGTGTLDVPDETWPDVTGLYYTQFSSGTGRIVATCSTRFHYLNSSNVWTTIGAGTGSITAGQNNQFVFTTALDNIIGTNNVDIPIRWAGGAADLYYQVSFTGLSAALTKANAVAFFKNYLIFANTTEGGTTYPTRFRWSNVGTINTWTDADYVDIGALGGQEITGLVELYDNLYVFLTDSIYKVSLVGGNDVFQVSKVADDIGAVAKNSIQTLTLSNASNGIVFLDKDKRIYFFNGVIAQDISTLITTVMGGLSGSRLQYAVSAHDASDYYLCATSGTGSTNNLCLDLQYQIGEWSKHTEWEANAMTHVLDANDTEQLYLGNYESMVFQAVDTDNRDDVGSATGTVTSLDRYQTTTASGLQVLYVSSASYVTGALVGAPIELTGGTGLAQTGTVAYNTSTGIVVTTDFATTPDTTTTFEVGAIDSFYTSKWYDFGAPARLKHFGEVYFWGEADVSSTHTLSYATDFSTDIESLSLTLSSSTSDSIWGSAIWGVSLWGDVDDIFRQAKASGQGRYFRVKFAEDDPQETFHFYGWIPVFQSGDVN